MLQQVRDDAQLLAQTLDGKMEWYAVYLKVAMPAFVLHELCHIRAEFATLPFTEQSISLS